MNNIAESTSTYPKSLQSIIVIFVYTELTLVTLFNMTDVSHIPAWELRKFLSSRNLRIIQILSLAFSYLWRLANTEE